MGDAESYSELIGKAYEALKEYALKRQQEGKNIPKLFSDYLEHPDKYDEINELLTGLDKKRREEVVTKIVDDLSKEETIDDKI